MSFHLQDKVVLPLVYGIDGMSNKGIEGRNMEAYKLEAWKSIREYKYIDNACRVESESLSMCRDSQ